MKLCSFGPTSSYCLVYLLPQESLISFRMDPLDKFWCHFRSTLRITQLSSRTPSSPPVPYSISNLLGILNNHSTCTQAVKSSYEENYLLSSFISNFCQSPQSFNSSWIPNIFPWRVHCPIFRVKSLFFFKAHISFLISALWLQIILSWEIRSHQMKMTSLSSKFSCHCPPLSPCFYWWMLALLTPLKIHLLFVSGFYIFELLLDTWFLHYSS